MVNIVLDLDETLIHTIVCDRPRPDLEKSADFQFKLGQDRNNIFYVFKRPGLSAFLAQVFKKFKHVGIWTAADSLYAKTVIKNILSYQQIMKLDFVFSRNFCEHDQQGFLKPLSKIYQHYPNWHPEETIMLDNSAAVMRQNPRNGIVAIDYVPPYLRNDIYLPIMTDVFQENLPKYRIYQFVERCNRFIPTIINAYHLDNKDRAKMTTQGLKMTQAAQQGLINVRNQHVTTCRTTDGVILPNDLIFSRDNKSLTPKQKRELQQAVHNAF